MTASHSALGDGGVLASAADRGGRPSSGDHDVPPAGDTEARRRAGLQPAPAPPSASDPVELRIALDAVRVVVLLAVPCLVVAWAVAGGGGLLGAAIGAGVVAGMFLISAGLLSFAARFGPSALMGAALGGFVLRLILYAVLIVLLTPIEAIHGPSLAITAALLLIASLAWEARMVTRTPGFFWVSTDSERT